MHSPLNLCKQSVRNSVLSEVLDQQNPKFLKDAWVKKRVVLFVLCKVVYGQIMPRLCETP